MNKYEIEMFQEDLRKGMSIEHALKKYGVSFKKAVELMPRHNKNKKKHVKWESQEKYIQKRDGSYYLRKNINGKTVMVGSYTTLKDAIKVRDYCIKFGWKQRSIDEYCEVLGVKRIKDSRSKTRYH